MNKIAANNRTQSIDFLRGIAFLAVFIYHSNLNFAPAGYLGVDLFFVISGYIICKKLLELEALDSRRFCSFIFRRFVRLIIPLSWVVSIGLIFSIFLSNAISLYTSSKMALGSLFFYSNYVAFREGGYFGPTGENLFLHTWSLSVEMQFYIALTVLTFLSSFILKSKPILSFFAINFLAFISSIFFLNLFNFISINFSFYSPLTRFWEFLAGVGVYCLTHNLDSKILLKKFIQFVHKISILLLILFLIFAKPDQIVGANNYCVVLLTSLILIKESYSGNIMVKGVSWLGRRSYSFYLVHYPIFLFLDASNFNFSSSIQFVLLALLTLFLGLTLFKISEK